MCVELPDCDSGSVLNVTFYNGYDIGRFFPQTHTHQWDSMDQERMQHLTRSETVWYDEEKKLFFSESHDRFAQHASASEELLQKLMRDNEQMFSHFLDSPERKEIKNAKQNFEEKTKLSLPSQLAHPGVSHTNSCFRITGCFPRFSMHQINVPRLEANMPYNKVTASWGGQEIIECSRSIFYKTHLNSYRFNSEGTSESFDVSESESEDEETSLAVKEIANQVEIEASRELSVSPSEVSEFSSESDNRRIPQQTDASVDQRRDRTFRLANELLTTERSYVTVLHLIDQIFHFRVDHENRAHPMFPQDTVVQMFSNIKSIYKFHNDFLLPKLEARMKDWDNDPRIGDIMKNFAPFLKLYTEYVKNFDSAMNIINTQQAKNSRFCAIMEEIHQMPECGNLTLPHHMLSPIQRVPRYELLLRDYLKKLPDDSDDRDNTEKALHLVSTAANHANEAMKKISQFQQLLEIQENISGAVDLVSPTRELLKEGRVAKISARSADHQERYLFLFSDVLLLCSPRLISNRVISGPTYRLRVKFDIESLQVIEGDNLETANTFYLRDHNKNVELYTHTLEEKQAWLDALFRAMEELSRRKSSLKISPDANKTDNGSGSLVNPAVIAAPDCDIGKRPPTLVRMDSVGRCMDCGSSFGVMRRKHHCHACGSVVCGKCSGHKMPLPCEENKVCRVCLSCYKILLQRSAPNSPGLDNLAPSFARGKGVLEVLASSPCVISDYLQLKTHKSWVTRWFALHRDFVLYSFKSDKDTRAMTATPLPGFTVAMVSQLKGEADSEKENMFKMYHTRKTYYFQASKKDEAVRWVQILQMAAQAELPSPEEDR